MIGLVYYVAIGLFKAKPKGWLKISSSMVSFSHLLGHKCT